MEVLAPEAASGSKSPFGPEPLVRKLRKVSWYFRPALFPSIERGILSDNQTKTPPKTPPFFLVLRSCAGRSHFYLIATLFRSRSRATFPLGVPASGHFAVAVLLVEATRTPDLLTTARGGPKCICTRATKQKKINTTTSSSLRNLSRRGGKGSAGNSRRSKGSRAVREARSQWRNVIRRVGRGPEG